MANRTIMMIDFLCIFLSAWLLTAFGCLVLGATKDIKKKDVYMKILGILETLESLFYMNLHLIFVLLDYVEGKETKKQSMAIWDIDRN